MKKVRGYIFSRQFMGERVPQHIQNQVIRNFCYQNNFEYLLSAAEYAMENSFLILNEIVNKDQIIDGIGFYSLFQLPENNEERVKLLKNIIKRKKFVFFSSENIYFKNLIDIKRINDIWLIKKNLQFSLKSFDY